MHKLLLFAVVLLLFSLLGYLPVSINLSTIQDAYAAQSTSANYVPGEVLIQYKNGASPDQLKAALGPQSLLGQVQSLLQQSSESKAQTLQKESDQVDKKAGIVGKKRLFQSASDSSSQLRYLIKLKKGQNIQTAISALKAQSDLVQFAEPNYIFHASATPPPNDPLEPQEWGLTQISMPSAWDLEKGSTNVKVGIIDSGIDYNHPDLPGTNIIKGLNFVTCTVDRNTGNCTDIPSCPPANVAAGYCDTDPMDTLGHGTHIAGIIGAQTNNGVGISGINWQVKLFAIRIMDSGGSTTLSRLELAMHYAVDNGANVINLSIESGNPTNPHPCSSDPGLAAAVNYALQHNVLVVASAGNGVTANNVTTPIDAQIIAPASCSGVMAVGATGPTDLRAQYSNYGSTVNIAAPGGDFLVGRVATSGILSTKSSTCDPNLCPAAQILNSNYLFLTGTSMAAPFVSGAAAILLSSNPNLSPQQIHDCLINNGDTITEDHPIGPRLNVNKALLACGTAPTGVATSTPTPTVTPTTTVTPTGTQGPTATPTPTGVSGPTVKLSFTILLDGIGSAGDQQNSNSSSSNQIPITASRNLRVLIFDNTNTQVVNQLCTIQYQANTGEFVTINPCDVGNIPTGNYLIKVKTDKYLTKNVGVITPLINGQINQTAKTDLVAGDINGDNKLTITDYNAIAACFFGNSSCDQTQVQATDLNDDGITDVSDYILFLREFGVQVGQ